MEFVPLEVKFLGVRSAHSSNLLVYMEFRVDSACFLLNSSIDSWGVRENDYKGLSEVPCEILTEAEGPTWRLRGLSNYLRLGS